jgi:hypothetical protein
MENTQPTRTVAPEVAMLHLYAVRSGDLTMEASMRILFPEDAANIYNLGNNRAGHALPD